MLIAPVAEANPTFVRIRWIKLVIKRNQTGETRQATYLRQATQLGDLGGLGQWDGSVDADRAAERQILQNPSGFFPEGVLTCTYVFVSCVH